MAARLRTMMIDCCGVAGVGLFSYGAWLAWHPAGYMLAGLLLAAGAYVVTPRRGNEA
jgi:hypothetical protein